MTNANDDLQSTLESLARANPDRWQATHWGVSRSGRNIPGLLHRDAYLAESGRVRVLLISGFSGSGTDVSLSLRALELYAAGGGLDAGIALSAAPSVNPDALADMTTGFPPPDNFYFDPEKPETRYLWRWACFQAPGLALEIRAADAVAWQANGAAQALRNALGAAAMGEDGSLLAALGAGAPDGLGPVPGLRLSTPPERLVEELERLRIAVYGLDESAGVSPARRVLDRRRNRSCIQVARILAATYGHELEPVNYTQGVGVSGTAAAGGTGPGRPVANG